MKTFFQTIKDSVYSPKFYSQIPKKTFKQAFSYFFLFILLLTSIRIITLINPLAVQAPQQIKKGAENLVNCYPNDLDISINQGQATSSAKQPYFVSCEKKEASTSAFLVVDINTPYSKEQFDKYQVPAWLSKNSLTVKQENDGIKTYDLSKVKNFKVDKNTVNSFYKTASAYFPYLGPVLVLLVFVVLYVGYIFNLVYLLILSLVLLLISNIMKKNFTYSQIYKTGLYAMTFAVIVDLVLDLLFPWLHFRGIPFMFTVITLLILGVNLSNASKD